MAVVDHRGEILCRNGTNTQRLTGSSEDWCLTFADAEYRRRCRLASSGTPARLAARSKRLSPGGGTGGFSAHTLQAGCPLHAVDFLRDSREYSGGVEEHPQHAFFRVFPPLHLPTHRSGKCLSPRMRGVTIAVATAITLDIIEDTVQCYAQAVIHTMVWGTAAYTSGYAPAAPAGRNV